MQNNFWKKQTLEKILFPDVEWSRPEQKSHAGTLGIIGGTKMGFLGVAESYQTAYKTGAGKVKLLLPESLKKTLPKTLTEAVFAPANNIGGFSKDAKYDFLHFYQNVNALLLAGDTEKNSETASVYEKLFETSSNTPIIITRDAVDLLLQNPDIFCVKENVVLVASFAQFRNLLQKLYYPKIVSTSMQLAQFVNTLHSFSISYSASFVIYFNEKIIIAQNGQVITQDYSNPLRIWRGQTASQIATYCMWSPKNLLEATACAIAK